jgi:hypothetical protein
MITDGLYVYYPDQYGTIRRVPVGGGAPEIVEAAGSISFALSQTSIFFSNASNIQAKSIPGGTPTPLAPTQQEVFRIAAANGQVIWAELTAPSSYEVAIHTVPAAGGPAQTIVATSPFAESIRLDSKHAFWITENRVSAVPLGGGKQVVLAANQSANVDIALDDTHVYWLANKSGGQISRTLKP